MMLYFATCVAPYFWVMPDAPKWCVWFQKFSSGIICGPPADHHLRAVVRPPRLPTLSYPCPLFCQSIENTPKSGPSPPFSSCTGRRASGRGLWRSGAPRGGWSSAPGPSGGRRPPLPLPSHGRWSNPAASQPGSQQLVLPASRPHRPFRTSSLFFPTEAAPSPLT